MRALLFYESMFGNTRHIAEAVAQGLAVRMRVVTADAAQHTVPDPAEFDLLVVGAPTHALTLPVPDTRAQAAARSDVEIETSDGVREFLAGLALVADLPVVAFDTRHRRMRHLPGSAARAATRLLARAGWRILAPPQSFYVASLAGPLLPGEVQRAANWGEQLGRLVALTAAPRSPVPPQP